MSTTAIVIVIVIVIVLVLIALAAVLSSRRQARRREEAEELRARATTHSDAIRSTRQETAAAESRADAARLEAERAEQEALDARRGLEMEEAHREDKLREADALDPDVDHRADDYEPGTGSHRKA